MLKLLASHHCCLSQTPRSCQVLGLGLGIFVMLTSFAAMILEVSLPFSEVTRRENNVHVEKFSCCKFEIRSSTTVSSKGGKCTDMGQLMLSHVTLSCDFDEGRKYSSLDIFFYQ